MGSVILNPFLHEDNLLAINDNLDIFTLEEYFQIRKRFNIGKDESSARKVIRTLEADGLLSKKALTDKDLDYSVNLISYNKGELYHYLLTNMLFARIPLNRRVIEENIYKSSSSGRKALLFYVYEKLKPSYFPNLTEIDDKYSRLQFLYCTLALFYKEHELDDDVIISEMTRHFRRNELFKSPRGSKLDRIKQFFTLSGNDFINNGILMHRDNLIEYLYFITEGKETLGKKERVLKLLSERMDKYKHTEFYTALREWVDEALNKNSFKLDTIDIRIRYWADFVDYVVDYDCVNIKDVTPVIRDLYIDEHGHEKDLINPFASIRVIIRHFNENKFKTDINNYVDDSIFSAIHIPKKPKDIMHISYMESAQDALVSSIASDIYQTRKDQAAGIRSDEHIRRFFLSRIIWLIFLTGARNSEIRELKLETIKSTILHKNPYIVIKTKKKNPDRVFELYRGENFEYDKVHLDILNETIEMTESLYKSIKQPINNTKWLFPNPFLSSYYTPNPLRTYFINVQKENAIICGSHYDIMQRDLYLSYPDMIKKIEEPTPLFGLHEIRHMHLDKLVLYGMTNQIELAKTIGHRDIESQETYKKAALGLLEVSRLMEEHEHYGAKNKLVASDSFKVDENISRERLILIEDVDAYMTELENEKDINVELAIDYIDINTSCETKISCGETGFGCLGCKDFVSGKANHEAILNTAVLLEHQMKVIDYEIQRLNDKRLRKKNKFNHFQELLMTILDRFEGIELAKNRTLISLDNFGWSENESEKFLARLVKRVRKVDIDKEVVKMVKNQLIDNTLHEEIVTRLHLIVSKTNKKVFV